MLLALVALLVFIASCTATTSTADTEQASVGKTSAALTAGDAGMGYGGCREPACADIARGCDDIIRSGCGAAFLTDQNGNLPSVAQCSGSFPDAIVACTVATMGELEEVAEKRADIVPGSSTHIDALALEFAKCTRRATTCEQRIGVAGLQTRALRFGALSSSTWRASANTSL